MNLLASQMGLQRRLKTIVLATLLTVTPCFAETGSEPQSAAITNEITGTGFAKYLKYQTYRLKQADKEVQHGGFVFGPGHHISAMAALVFDETGRPCATFKTGDTRLSRALRGEPYVAVSGIAGRWDKEGHSAGEIVLAELSEEVGGEVVEGTFRRLGDHLAPTMPWESTESDEFFRAAVEITGDSLGDGGRMEVAELIGPVFFPPQEAIKAMDDGRISDSGRARAMFGRAWASLGYLPSLDLYVQDHPQLLERYDSLGLGPVEELRDRVKTRPLPEPPSRKSNLKAQINSVAVQSCQTVELLPDNRASQGRHTMVDARICHAVEKDGQKTVLPPEFASQYLRTNYDRAKVVVYVLDPEHGPLVQMTSGYHPVMAFAPGAPRVWRRDITDLVVEKRSPSQGPESLDLAGATAFYTDSTRAEVAHLQHGQLKALARHNAASSGQSDLFYHYLSCRLDTLPQQGSEHFLPLSDALRLCRSGHGDAQTEATLLRLADHLEWIPELGMSRSVAQSLLR